MVRYTLDLSTQSHIGQTQLNVLGLLNISDSIEFVRLNHVFKIINIASPVFLKGTINRISHGSNTRACAYIFFIPQLQGFASSTFFYSGIKDWNRLTNDIKSSLCLLSFKTKVRKYLIEARLKHKKCNSYTLVLR